MGTINTYTAYHATDKSNVSSILKRNFLFHSKDTHWLGDGVYFFLDKGLAIAWGNNCPTKKYGKITIPAIIECIISVDDDFVCDMRQLQTYNRVKNAFDIFWGSVYKAPCTAKYDDAFFEKLECAFFNWLTKKLSLKCIVCVFQKRLLPVEETEFDTHFRKFGIPCVEIQLCIKDISHIANRKQIL